ncbi:MAG TPA: hypothetical protein VFT74_00805 [Isosphaeraceae bacterium]|nr:hypothetical protein [Isosphaeraceae bacterium]
MSDQFIDTSSDEFIDAPRALRDAYDQLKARYTETAKERDTYKGRAESSALGDVLKGFTKPERVKSALLADGVDPLDSEAVSTWVAENGNDFARGEASPAQSQPSVDDSEAEAHQRLQSSDNLRQPADMSKLEAALAEAGPNATGQELEVIYRKHGL